ncbi:AAA family ATPase [Flavobacterium sp.]
MKIAFTGSHGVGKTTLINRLENELLTSKDVAVTKEIPRIICELVDDPEYFRRGANNLEKQLLIFLGQIIQEYELSLSNFRITICDRTIFDHWAYTLYLFGKDLSHDYIKIIEYFMLKHMVSYDKIFYIPIEFEVEDDGTREDDKEFQKNIDSIIISNLDKFKLPYLIIDGSIENRIKLVQKELEL